MAEGTKPYHTKTAQQIFQELGTHEDNGLTNVQVEAARKLYGWNELKEPEKTPLWKLIAEQFEDLLVRILLGAAILSFIIAAIEEGVQAGFSAFVEPVVILLILIINAAVGVWQESNAENALEALKKLQPKFAKAYRNGTLEATLPARDLVPGDLVEVRVGDKVPADLRIVKLKTTTLRVDESALTGESKTKLKDIAVLPENLATCPNTDKVNMLFSGTTITGGIALAIVVGIGMNTEIGKIHKDVSEAEDEKTPLKEKLEEFGNTLTKVIGAICVLVWAINYNHFFDPIHGSALKGGIYYLKIAVALGVAAIPEGLPAVITLCLALGTRRMVKKNAIVRKLPSVETLGCTTVICSDKTGTLTLNEMTAISVVTSPDNPENPEERKVLGELGYNPEGRVEEISVDSSSLLADIALVCSNCNEAALQFKENKFVRVGEPTEAALKVLAEKIGVPNQPKPTEKAELANFAHNFYTSERQFRKLATLEFSRGRKSMSVIGVKDGRTVLLCKGAPEGIIDRSESIKLGNGQVVRLTAQAKESLLNKVQELAARPLRTLAFAVTDQLPSEWNGFDGSPDFPPLKQLAADPERFAELEARMTFLGFCGIKDPARPEVKDAVEKAKGAGIRVIMITGDNKETAEAIAKEIGIFEAGEDVKSKSYTGKDFMALDHEQRARFLMEGGGGRVFSRTDPKDKSDIVNILKERGEIAAMTGDGVNDAPALKAASIGIAMGIAGTEVAKEASAMILADDNFATIVSAVEEGRAIYANMKAFIRYLISSNIGEVASIFLTAALGLPEGMSPVQLLWVNLVTDGPPATALGFNAPEPDIMQRPPRRRDDQLITGWIFFRYVVIGVYVGLATVGIFIYWFLYFQSADGHTLISWNQLSTFGHCQNWPDFKVNDFRGISLQEHPCEYFTHGKVVASTLSLTVLVTIEMFNAMNALSEDASLLQVKPWSNPYLLLAILCSFSVHLIILYVPGFAELFELAPLTLDEWVLVLMFSFPVTIIDEVLKVFGRMRFQSARLAAKKRQ